MKGFLYDVARGTAVALSVGLVLHAAKRAALMYGAKLPASYNPALPVSTMRDTGAASMADLVGLLLSTAPSKPSALVLEAPKVAPVSGVPTAAASHDTETQLARERA
jgi:hypothetical protein